jgi:hypothetical protein
MINLTNTSSNLKKIGLPIIVITLAGFFTFLIYSRYIKPPKLTPIQKPTIQTLPITTDSLDTSNLTVDGKLFQKLPVFENQKDVSLLENAVELAIIFGFNQNPQEMIDTNEGKTLVYLDEKTTLLLRKEVLSYMLTVTTNNQGGNINFENSRIAAQNLFTKLGLQTEQLKESRLVLLKELTGETVPLLEPENAKFINIQYEYQLSGIPIVMPTTPLSITLDNQDNLISLIYRDFKQPDALQEFPIISFQHATELLLSQKGSAININEGQEASDFSNIENVTLTKAFLAYYIPSQAPKLIQPFWIFEGEIPNGETIAKIQYAIPAIPPQYFESIVP